MRLYAKRVMLFAGGGVDQWNLITLLWWLWLWMVWGQDSSCDRNQPISRCLTVTWSFQSMQGIALTIGFIIQNEKHFSPNNKSTNINQPVKETTLLMLFFYLFFFLVHHPPKKDLLVWELFWLLLGQASLAKTPRSLWEKQSATLSKSAVSDWSLTMKLHVQIDNLLLI